MIIIRVVICIVYKYVNRWSLEPLHLSVERTTKILKTWSDPLALVLKYHLSKLAGKVSTGLPIRTPSVSTLIHLFYRKQVKFNKMCTIIVTF